MYERRYQSIDYQTKQYGIIHCELLAFRNIILMSYSSHCFYWELHIESHHSIRDDLFYSVTEMIHIALLFLLLFMMHAFRLVQELDQLKDCDSLRWYDLVALLHRLNQPSFNKTALFEFWIQIRTFTVAGQRLDFAKVVLGDSVVCFQARKQGEQNVTNGKHVH